MSYLTNSTRRITSLGRTLIRNSRFALPLFGVAAASLLAPTSAKATLILTLDEISGPNAGATASVSDPTNTSVIYDSSLGDFSADIDIGFSNESSPGTGAEATLQVHTLEVTSTISTPVVLQVLLTDDGFTFPGSSGDTLSLTSSLNAATFVGSSSTDMVQFQSTAFDPTAVSTTLQQSNAPVGGGTGTGSLPADQSATFVRGTTYTLKNVTTLYFSNANEQENVGGTTTTLDLSSSVPEPTSLSALAIGGLLLMRRRRSAN